MKNFRFSDGVLLVLTMAVAGFWIDQRRTLRDESVNLEKLHSQHVQAENRSDPSKNPNPRQANAHLNSVSQKEPEAVHSLTSEQWHDLTLKYYVANFEMNYHQFFRRMNLSANDEDKFAQLFADWQSKGVELRKELSGLKRGDPSYDLVQNELRQANASYQSDIQTEFGMATYDQYIEFTKTFPIQTISSQLEEHMALSSTPITAVQSDLLTSLLINSASGNNGAITANAIDWQNAITQASAFLSVDQIRCLTLIAQANQARNEMAANASK